MPKKIAKKKVGRPKTGQKGSITFRADDADRAAYERSADKAGIKLTEWIRRVCNKAAGR